MVKLAEIRSHCRSVNLSVSTLLPIYHVPTQGWGRVVSNHNTLVASAANNIGRLVDEAMPLLDELMK